MSIASRDVQNSSRLRREVFALGGRHRGDPLAGALQELQEEGLTAERRTLLRAVVNHLAADPSPAPQTRRGNWKPLVVIAAAAACGIIQIWYLAH